MEFYANLHSHCTHSDGKYTPEEIVKVAKEEGYKAFAITDHDTATSWPHLKAACEKEGLDYIFGVEFTANSPLLKSGYFHMVAFNFDPEYPEMKDYLQKLSINETAQTKYCFDRGVAEGKLLGITWDEVLDYNKDITWLCNEHLFRAMKAKGLVTDLDYGEFFRSFFGPRRYEFQVPYEFLQVDELIDLVHRAGGIILVAHPKNQLHLIDNLLEMGLDGLEVWHADLTEEERALAFKIGTEKKLFMSGGSDHSGLCGGMYDTYEDPTTSPHYIEPMSCGVPYEYFVELKNGKVNR